MSKFVDEFSGTYVGKLHIRRVSDSGGYGRHIRYECECHCGNVVSIRSTLLRQAASDRTCGRCLSYICGGSTNAKAIYNVWLAIKYLCYEVTMKESDSMYFRYRDRGIRMHKRWYLDVNEFARWAVKSGWKKGLQLDRIDNDGHYTPKNCRFVSPRENSNNRECTPMFEYDGKPARALADIVREYSVVSHTLVFQRVLRMDWDLHEALTTPARKGNYR